MADPVITALTIGREARKVAIIDDFVADPECLREAAAAASFGAARHHYPGVRAKLPPDYLDRQQPVIAAALREVFGRDGSFDVVDASFSIVTTPHDALTVHQRLPHCDAFLPGRIALLHYLSLEDGDGTAFFRHRSTGYETISERRAPTYFRHLDAELREAGGPQPGYIAGDTAQFERIALAEARYNRALLYPSYLLHSGAIAPGASLSSDPLKGRLTVTGFLSTA